MRPLELDFIAPPAIGNLAGVLLLATGLAVLTATVLDALEAGQIEQDLQARRASEWRRAHGVREPARPAPALRPEDLRTLREAAAVAARLTLPWQRLFDDTAQAAGEGVALTGLQPDAAARTVRITGLARDLPAVNGFVERLLATPGFANAYLVQHDLQAKDAQAALNFVVLATWREGRP
jgi:hypothetical protein